MGKYQAIVDSLEDNEVDDPQAMANVVLSKWTLDHNLAPAEVDSWFADFGDYHPERTKTARAMWGVIADSGVDFVKTVWNPLWDVAADVFDDLKVVYIARDVVGRLLSCYQMFKSTDSLSWFINSAPFDLAEDDVLVRGCQSRYGIEECDMRYVYTAMYHLLADYCYISELLSSDIPALFISYESLTSNHRFEVGRLEEFLGWDIVPYDDPVAGCTSRESATQDNELLKIIDIGRQCCCFWNDMLGEEGSILLPGPALASQVPLPTSLFTSSTNC
jgi:hypothetical protein